MPPAAATTATAAPRPGATAATEAAENEGGVDNANGGASGAGTGDSYNAGNQVEIFDPSEWLSNLLGRLWVILGG